MAGLRVTGDFAELSKWAKRFAELGGSMADLSNVLAEDTAELTRQSFETESSPDGKPWAPIMRDGAILQHNGHLKASIAVDSSTKEGWRVIAAQPYASYHQNGTGVYGPRGQPIRPKRGKMLRWKSGGATFFARTVRGAKPRPFFPKNTIPAKWRQSWALQTRDMISEMLG